MNTRTQHRPYRGTCSRSPLIRPVRTRQKRPAVPEYSLPVHQPDQPGSPPQAIAQSIADCTGLNVRLVIEAREDVQIEASTPDWDVTVRMPEAVHHYHGAAQMWSEYAIASLQRNRMLSEREFRLLMERN